MAKTPTIDNDRLRQLYDELGGEREVMREVAETFLSDLDHNTQRFIESVQMGEFEEQLKIAHTLKGTSATLGAVWLKRAAEALEQALRQAQEEGATLQGGLESELLAALKATPDGLRQALRELAPGIL